jgi:histidyl-tRNA synthetase
MAQKAGLPKGMRDFLPFETQRRKYIFNTIEKVYQSFGFQSIETPIMENLSSLTGKYGDEGDKLLFKVLNSGDFLSKVDDEVYQQKNSKELSSKICEKGLRYDLTVPFARYVVQHQNDINFPFKRYQIQAVWRADRPQKGRYREFYQCDADVIGSTSLLNEAELIQIIENVFKNLNLKVEIKINNRKLLSALAQVINATDKITDITVAIDKLDKMPFEKVISEIEKLGIDKSEMLIIEQFLNLNKLNRDEKLSSLKELFKDNETGLNGIQEIQKVLEYTDYFEISNKLTIDTNLARGLDYYTGTIIEVVSLETKMGSICGGGRYDDLTGVFGLNNMSGVGISFGADRIYDIMLDLEKFPDGLEKSTEILLINFGEKEEKYCLDVLKKLRENNIIAELYPDQAKLKKQFSYADKKNIPYVLIIGENEISSGQLTFKDMKSGNQENIDLDSIIKKLK